MGDQTSDICPYNKQGENINFSIIIVPKTEFWWQCFPSRDEGAEEKNPIIVQVPEHELWIW